jgi:hypothetical protein
MELSKHGSEAGGDSGADAIVRVKMDEVEAGGHEGKEIKITRFKGITKR